MEKLASRRVFKIGIPRIEPVPTAPAPPIWNTDFGLIPKS